MGKARWVVIGGRIGAVRMLEAVEASSKLSNSLEKLGCCRVAQICRYGTWSETLSEPRWGALDETQVAGRM